jgi:hypothetical protein
MLAALADHALSGSQESSSSSSHSSSGGKQKKKKKKNSLVERVSRGVTVRAGGHGATLWRYKRVFHFILLKKKFKKITHHNMHEYTCEPTHLNLKYVSGQMDENN